MARPRLRRSVLLLACTLALALPGCMAEGVDPLHAQCGVPLSTDAIPDAAPHEGGPGEATVRVKVLDESSSSLARVPVLAWWKEGDRVDFVALRTGGDGLARIHAPTAAHVLLASGDGAWTHDGSIVAGQPPPRRSTESADDVLELLPAMADGFVDGRWYQVVPVGVLPLDVGPTRVWEPTAMPWADAHHLARLTDLHVRLAWRNNDDGIVDLAIGVGTEDDWQQWNQEVQTTQGQFQEDLTLDRAALDAAGWLDGGSLSVGPALGTFGAHIDPAGLTTDVRWTAHFAIDPTLGDLCAGLGDVRLRDVTARST